MSAPEPEFSSVSEADATYYGGSNDGPGDGGDGPDPDGDGTRWGQPQEEPTDWVAGWTLIYQDEQQTSNPARRWFIIRYNPDTGAFEALSMAGQADEYEGATWDELPHTEAESEAREAYQTWVDENVDDSGDVEDTDGAENWGEWTQITQVSDWTIWGREHKTEDRVQFLAASTMEDGTPVYLQPDGTVSEDAHIYDSQEAMQQALNAYAERVESGDIPESERPTGTSPGRGQIREDAAAAGANGGGSGRNPVAPVVEAVGGTRTALLLGVVVAGGVYYAEKQGHIDITEAL